MLNSMTDRPDQAPLPAVAPGAVDAAPEPPPVAPDDRSLDRVRAVCPHLVAGDGDWRTVVPAREHRCTAVDPPAPLALDKQRRLCLTEEHVGCATYLAAARSLVVDESSSTRSPDAALGAAGPGALAPDEPSTSQAARPSAAGRWPMPRTAPVVVDRGGFSLASWRPDRPVAQLGLVALMVLAFVVLAVARLTSDGGSAAGPSPSSSLASIAVPSTTPGSSSPASSASPSVVPSAIPGASAESGAASGLTASPAASPTAYRVRSGDTLTSIAARFGTSVAILRRLNDIADPSLLRVGQLLQVP
jgi:LysM repeat protein